jgi:hypothetical protein
VYIGIYACSTQIIKKSESRKLRQSYDQSKNYKQIEDKLKSIQIEDKLKSIIDGDLIGFLFYFDGNLNSFK